MPLGKRLTIAIAWLIAAIALGLPAVVCGQQPLAAVPTAPPDLPPSEAQPLPAMGPGVCPECGQPYDPSAAEDSGGRLVPPWLGNIFIHPPWERSGGPTDPVWRESWLFRPLSVGVFAGAADGLPADDPMRASTTAGGIGGIRAGWDLNHYWGTETRLAWSTGQFEERLLGGEYSSRTNSFFWDLDLLYYPWGDSRWRPYFLVGMGTTQVRYLDVAASYGNTFSMPLAVGVKYRWNDYFALRLELGDDIAMPGYAERIMHNLSITTGLEFRFGGTRKVYWPYEPGL